MLNQEEDDGVPGLLLEWGKFQVDYFLVILLSEARFQKTTTLLIIVITGGKIPPLTYRRIKR